MWYFGGCASFTTLQLVTISYSWVTFPQKEKKKKKGKPKLTYDNIEIFKAK